MQAGKSTHRQYFTRHCPIYPRPPNLSTRFRMKSAPGFGPPGPPISRLALVGLSPCHLKLLPELALFRTISIGLECWNNGIWEWWGVLVGRDWVRLAHLPLRPTTDHRLPATAFWLRLPQWAPWDRRSPDRHGCGNWLRFARLLLNRLQATDYGLPPIGFVLSSRFAGPIPRNCLSVKHLSFVLPGQGLGLFGAISTPGTADLRIGTFGFVSRNPFAN